MTALRTLTAGPPREPQLVAPAAPPPVLPPPPPLHHEPTGVCRLDHLQVRASLGHDLASPTSERPRQAGHQPTPSMAPESLRFYPTGTADVTDEDSIGVNKEAVRTEGAAQTAGAQADWRPRGPFSAPVPQGTGRPAGGRGSAGSSQKLLAAFWGLSVKQECQGSRSQCVGLRVAVTGQRAVASVTGSHHLCPMALPRACAGEGRGAGYPGRVNGAAKQEGKKPRGCRRSSVTRERLQRAEGEPPKPGGRPGEAGPRLRPRPDAGRPAGDLTAGRVCCGQSARPGPGQAAEQVKVSEGGAAQTCEAALRGERARPHEQESGWEGRRRAPQRRKGLA